MEVNMKKIAFIETIREIHTKIVELSQHLAQ